MTSTTAPRHRYGLVQRTVLSVSAALAARAEASARKEPSAARDAAQRRDARLSEAELRRDAAIMEQLQMPRQF